MTKIYYTEQGKNTFILEIKGHAGYAEYGNDIVCSAVSILAQTLIRHMDNVADHYECRVDPGDVWLWAKGKEAMTAAATILTGFEMLDRDYSEYVKLYKRVS